MGKISRQMTNDNLPLPITHYPLPITHYPLPTMTDLWTDVLSFAQTTTDKVGKYLLSQFGQVQAEQKPDGSLVTIADKWADNAIREAIASNFPGHGMLTEETEHVFDGSEWYWVIDPLDGTTNFTRGIPIWGISLALLYKGTPVFGYVHFPPLNQSFHAFYHPSPIPDYPLPKFAAFLNNRPIHTSDDALSGNHFFSLCARSTAVMKQPFPCKIRMLGVASYNFLCVASGAALGAVEATPKIWDLAGVWVIIQAAGGAWVSLNSEPIFPLEAGKNYGNSSFPTLVASREELVPVFKPYVEYLGNG
jgi:myo-inositol-1(or 4)-monophosphatase